MKGSHWLKKGAALLVSAALLASQMVPAFAEGTQNGAPDELKIATLSDTHYLSPTMIKDTADYTNHLNSDRKMFTESSALLKGLLATIEQDKPDVLLISGDLTKDGELEGHQGLAAELRQLKNKLPQLHVYLAPGNHDLRNSNGMNFNTADGVAVPATRTNPEDYKEAYADVTYNDPTVVETYTPPQGKEAGGLSYVARPKEGFTLISIDSARYSSDNTDSGLDEHETSGAISADLERWILEQIHAAKLRGDTVMGMQHHGMVEHFSMEPDLLPMYLVNDYQRLREEFADAGMQYIFTGHMHANDIAKITTAKGNDLYDIETGSVVTYPSPTRSVTLTRQLQKGQVKEQMDVRTTLGVGPITFTNPLDGKQQTIDDITAYGKQHGFTNEMLTTTANSFLYDFYAQIAETGSKKAVEDLITKLVNEMAPQYAGLVAGKPLEQLIPIALGLLMPGAPQAGEKFQYWYTDSTLHISYGEGKNPIAFDLPASAIGQAVNALFDSADKLFEDPAALDGVVAALVEKAAALPVSQDGETTRTLLDYANYIYQNHLSGTDNQAQLPQWVQDARAYAAGGGLVNDLVDVLIEQVSAAVDIITDKVSVNDLLGIQGIDATTKEWVAQEGRTPLLEPANDNSKTALLFAVAFVMGAKPDSENPNLYVLPDDYSLKDLLAVANKLLGSLGVTGVDLNIQALLTSLVNGKEGQGGLLDAQMRGQLTGLVLSVVDSMGNDSNYPEDNNTQISYTWNLLTDRTALDQAIRAAEALDLSLYTDASAQAVRDALQKAKGLSVLAAQQEMDAAASALQQAIGALELLSSNGGSSKPNDDVSKPHDAASRPATGSTNKQTPVTGDGLPVLLASAAVLAAASLLVRKKRR